MAVNPDELRAFAAQYRVPEAGVPASSFQGGGSFAEELRRFGAEFADTGMPDEGVPAAALQQFGADYEDDVGLVDEFGRGLDQGVDMVQASLYAMVKAVGREIGFDTLEGFGEEGMRQNIESMSKFAPTVARFSDIDSFDDFFKWSAGAFGQAIPSLGAAMAGGGLGGLLIRKKVERDIINVVKSRMMRQMKRKGFPEDQAEAAIAKALNSKAGLDMVKNGFQNGNARLISRGFTKGAAIGAMIPSSAIQAGETEMTLDEAGIEAGLGTIFGVGLAGGALEMAPAVAILDRFFPGVDKKIASSFLKDFAKASGSQFLLEGGTEAGQELLQLASLAWHDPSFDPSDPELKLQVLDAFAAGALVGAITGGGSQTIARVTQNAAEQSRRSQMELRGKLASARARATEEGKKVKGAFTEAYDQARRGGPATEAERVSTVAAPTVTFPEDFEPADNTLYEELKTRAQAIIDEKIGPVLNSFNEAFNKAQDKAGGSSDLHGIASPYAGFAKYREMVEEGQAEFVAGHQPVLEDTVRYAREFVMWLAEEAAGIDPSWSDSLQFALGLENSIMTANWQPAFGDSTWESDVAWLEAFKQDYGITGNIRDGIENGTINENLSPKTQEYVLTQMALLRKDVGSVASEMGLRGEKLMGSIAGSIDTDPILQDSFVGAPDEADTEFVFGQMEMRTMEQGGKQRYRTVGPNAKPYKDRYQARVNMNKLKEEYPSAPEEAFSIREVDGGYVIAINDSGIRVQLREDEVISEAIEKSRRSARGNPNKKRHVTVKLLNRKANVRLDIPTLVQDGKRLGEGDNQTVEDAFDSMMGALFERNIIDDVAFEALREGFLKNYPRSQRRMTLKQAQRARAKRAERGAATALQQSTRQRKQEAKEGKRHKTKTAIKSKKTGKTVTRKRLAKRGKEEQETSRGDFILGNQGVTEDTRVTRTFGRGVDPTAIDSRTKAKDVEFRPSGERAGAPRMRPTGQVSITEETDILTGERNLVQEAGREDTTPAQDDATLAESLPTEQQQAEQSARDTGGYDQRKPKRRRPTQTSTALNIELLKRALAKFPPPSKRTKKQQREYEDLAWALNLLDRNPPKNAQQNNRLNRTLAKYLPKDTSNVITVDKEGKARKSTRDQLADKDPEGKKVSLAKPKPLKYKWVATLHGAEQSDGVTRTSEQRRAAKDKDAAMMQDLTNKGLHVDLSSDTKSKAWSKRVKWLVAKVQKLIPNHRIVVMDRDAVIKMVATTANQDLKQLGIDMIAYPNAVMRYMNEVNGVVIMTPSFTESPTNALRGLIHELGHAIHFATWRDIGLEGQKKLWEAFLKDVKAGRRGTGKKLEDVGPLNVDQANIYEFNEWMADQFVIWMGNRREPRTALEKFFRKLEGKLRDFYNILSKNPNRMGAPLNETYAEFADAVARRAAGRGDPATDHWLSGTNRIGSLTYAVLSDKANKLDLHIEGMERDLAEARSAAHAHQQAKQKTNKAKINKNKETSTPYRGLELEAWREMLPREVSYNEFVRSGKQLTQLLKNLYEVALAPSTSVMKSLSKQGITAADKLVNIFNRTPGTRPTTPNYHQQVARMSRGFWNRYTTLTKDLSDATKRQLMEDLRAGNSNRSLQHQQLRKLLDDVHEYLVAAGLPVGKIENYIPKMFDKQKLLDNEEAIIEHYANMYRKENQSTQAEALEFGKAKFNSLISREAEQAAAEQELQQDELSMETPGFQAMRHRYTQSEFMDQFLDTNLDSVLSNYFNHAVKRAEYNRRLGSKAKEGLTGGDTLSKRQWNSQEKLDQIFEEARAQGATEAQLMRMKNYVDANLGMYGRDEVGDATRKFMAGLVAYNNMRVLLFTVFASLPDMMGPIVRSNDAKTAFQELRKNFKAIVQNSDYSELGQMAQAYGIVIDDVSQSVLTEYVDNHFMPTGLKKWNDAFFKYTGLNWYTDSTRKYALAVGIKSFENAARDSEIAKTPNGRKKAKKFLQEFNLTPQDVRDWVAAGKPVYNSGTYATQAGTDTATRDDKMAAALVQFVNESIMSPNASQRPIAASHPGLMLVYHLKGFMYAMYDVFLKRMKYNWDEAKTTPEMLAVATPAIGMLALTAAGLELRDLVTGNDTRDRQDSWEYMWTLTSRSGLLGPAQLGWDFEAAGDMGRNELVAISGPTLSHAADLISKPLSQTIPKSIPVVSQLPWMRDTLREVTPL
jgi:hypothetical protein